MSENNKNEFGNWEIVELKTNIILKINKRTGTTYVLEYGVWKEMKDEKLKKSF